MSKREKINWKRAIRNNKYMLGLIAQACPGVLVLELIYTIPFEIIIMDEPSSTLDPVAEYELNQSIIKSTKDKTVIFISHRLATTRMADRIYMFSNGRIVERGSHEELMRQKGKYVEMYRVQAKKCNSTKIG